MFQELCQPLHQPRNMAASRSRTSWQSSCSGTCVCFPVFRDFRMRFYKCLKFNKFSFKNLRFWVSRAIFAACLYVARSTSRAAPASRWWTRAVADTMSCAALGRRARNGRSGVLRPRGGNMSRNTATPSFPFSAKALTRGLRSWSPAWATAKCR